MAHFPSAGAFAEFLQTVKAPIQTMQRRGLERICVAVKTEAKSALGTYKYGWPRLSPKTIALKRTGDSPLLETGTLRASIMHTVHSHERATVFSDDPKARYLSYGTSRMPPRPFLEPAAALKTKGGVTAMGQDVAVVLGAGKGYRHAPAPVGD